MCEATDNPGHSLRGLDASTLQACKYYSRDSCKLAIELVTVTSISNKWLENLVVWPRMQCEHSCMKHHLCSCLYTCSTN